MAIASEEYSRAENIRIQFMSSIENGVRFDYWSQQCSLFFGAAWGDIRLVKYVVEVRGVSRREILSRWNVTYLEIGDNVCGYKRYRALRYAMDHGQKTIVEYLL